MEQALDVTIISGMSGAGRSEAARVLEDLGFFVIDNLPPQLIGKMAELGRGQDTPIRYALVVDVRAAGVPVGLATNGTDRLDADLAEFGIADLFDAIVNASAVGVAKPHPEFFAIACRALGVPPAECLFVDDSARFVAGARAAGLLAYRYTGVDDLRYVRAALGV